MNTDTLILRFSDPEDIDTITEHQKIIHENGCVYWGWWKKDFETFPDNLNGAGEKEIWIIERDKNLFYKAKCLSIVIAKDKTQTPNVNLTPSYYNQKRQAAWFQLASLLEANESEYRNTCGGIPVTDATLFVVGKFPELIERPEWVDVDKGTSILHISDIHFGQFHNYPCKNNLSADCQPSLLEVVENKLHNKNIAIVVASGDFVSLCGKENFEEAQVFLDLLLNRLDIDKKRLLIVPGNHDRSLDDKSDGDPFEFYREFRESLLGIPKTQNIAYLKCFRLSTQWRITFSCLNSAKPINEKFKSDYKEYGKIDIVQCKELLEMLNYFLEVTVSADLQQEEYLAKKILNFCVIHHHMKRPVHLPKLDPDKKKDISLILNSRSFEDNLLKYGIRFLLHGHQHVSYPSVIANRDGQKLKFIDTLGVGSVGAKSEQGYDEFPWNSFSIYTPTDECLEIQVYDYKRNGERKTETYTVPYRPVS